VAAPKKNAARLGAHIVFVDESGFALLPSVQKTWAPRGVTPILRHRFRRLRLSAISGVSVSPLRQRVGLHALLGRASIGHVEVFHFLRELMRHLRGRVVVVWDNASIHKGKDMREFLRLHPRLQLESFPPYAPEINPDEGVWNHCKHYLANGRPDDLDELVRDVSRQLRKLRGSQVRLRALIRQSELPPFLV
jgi:transposase